MDESWELKRPARGVREASERYVQAEAGNGGRTENKPDTRRAEPHVRGKKRQNGDDTPKPKIIDELRPCEDGHGFFQVVRIVVVIVVPAWGLGVGSGRADVSIVAIVVV